MDVYDGHKPNMSMTQRRIAGCDTYQRTSPAYTGNGPHYMETKGYVFVPMSKFWRNLGIGEKYPRNKGPRYVPGKGYGRWEKAEVVAKEEDDGCVLL